MATGLIGAAVILVSRAGISPVPEFAPPYVEVQTEALGLSAEEVEQLITVPLEADLLNGVEDVEVLRSESVAGLSRIVMVFAPDVRLSDARARVQEKLTQAHALPQVSKPPTMLQPLSASSRLMMISLDSDTLTPIERSVLARWTIRPRLMGIPGVANVAIWGQRERQLQVQVDPQVLTEKRVTLDQVVSTAGNAQIVSPLTFLEASTPGTGGFIETAQQRLQVRHVFDNLATPDELGRVVVDGTNGQLLLRDVATVVESHQPLIGDAIVQDRGEGLLLVVERFPHVDPKSVIESVEAALDELRPGLQGMHVDSTLYRASDYSSESSRNLASIAAAGLILLVVAMGLWFRSWRIALVAIVSMAAALSAAALLLISFHRTFNLVSLGALTAGAALVIYDAITGAAAGLARTRGFEEEDPLISRTVSISTLGIAMVISVVSVLPIAQLNGQLGSFFGSGALAYAGAAVASFVAALVITPAVASLLLPTGRPPLRVESSPRRAISPLASSVARPVAGMLCLVSLVGLSLARVNVVPVVQDRDIVVRLGAPPGTSLPAMSSIVGATSERLRGVTGVESVVGHVGRAVTGDQIVDVNSAELWVKLSVDAPRDETLGAISDIAAGAGVPESQVISNGSGRIEYTGSLASDVDKASSDLAVLTGHGHPLRVRVYGEEPAVLLAKATEVQRAISGIPGVIGAAVVVPQMQDSLAININLDKAKAYGIKPGDVRRAEAVLVQGIQVGSIFEGQKVFDVMVQGVPQARTSADAVRSLVLDTPTGQRVRLGDVADVNVTKTPLKISRDAVARHIDVVANLDGISSEDALDDAHEAIEDIQFPLEHHAEVMVSDPVRDSGGVRFLAFSLGAAAVILLLFQTVWGSWRMVSLAALSMVASLSGGVLVGWIIGFDLGAILGLLVLVGVASRNTLALLRQSPAADNLSPPDGANPPSARFVRHIALGAALGTAAAFIPAAVGGLRPGFEVIQPMALVILGGLVTCTLVALWVLPPLHPSEERAAIQPQAEALR